MSLTRMIARKESCFIGIMTVVLIATNAALIKSAKAQTYVGNAYGANIGINANLQVAGASVGATIVNTGNLPGIGSATPFTSSLANADVDARGSGGLGSLFNVLDADVITSKTQGSAGTATSSTDITGLSLLPGLNINILGINLDVLNNTLRNVPLVSAGVINSTTTADASGNRGRTQIANLRFGVNTIGDVNITDGSSLTYYLTTTGGLSATASADISLPDIARLVINGQSLSDNGTTRTTNALQLSVLPLGQASTGDIAIASSTAGFRAAVVPEADTFSLVGLGVTALGGVLIRRRLRLKQAA